METPVATRSACFSSSVLSLHTSRSHDFVDITDHVSECVADSEVRDGLVVVMSQHTTAGIAVNEHEPELLKDLDGFLHEMAPRDRDYHHNEVPCEPGEYPNGHSHCQALLLSASASIPIAAGRPMLGRYQRIFLVELDRPRPRRVVVTVLGS
jgi:secondary thiamine-phosphate synthase enzyme